MNILNRYVYVARIIVIKGVEKPENERNYKKNQIGQEISVEFPETKTFARVIFVYRLVFQVKRVNNILKRPYTKLVEVYGLLFAIDVSTSSTSI